jgi:hypothetical protein
MKPAYHKMWAEVIDELDGLISLLSSSVCARCKRSIKGFQHLGCGGGYGNTRRKKKGFLSCYLVESHLEEMAGLLGLLHKQEAFIASSH